MTELWLPQSARDAHSLRKETAPRLGNAYGAWAGRPGPLDFAQMPAGGLLAFDLSKLTLADFRGMLDHYQVQVCHLIQSFMLHQIDWHLESDDKALASKLEDILREVWTELIMGTAQARWAGYSPMVIDWGSEPGSGAVVIDRVKDLVPEECYVHWKKVQGATAPGFNTGPTFFEYDGIVQVAPGAVVGDYAMAPFNTGQPPIPAENTLWYPFLMKNGNYYGHKLLRSAFPSYFFSIIMHLYANRYFERFGEPTPIGRAPFEDDVTVTAQDGSQVTMSGRQAMQDILMNLRSRGVVILPNDRMPVGDGNKTEYEYDIEYLESQMRGADFERYLQRLDEEISLSIFTPLLMLKTAPEGSNNLGVTHTQMYLWMLNALAQDLKQYIDRYVLIPLRDFNAGARAPKVRWVHKQLGKDNVETVRAIITQLIRYGGVGADLTELGDAVGLTLKQQQVLQQPAPAPAPGGPNQPGGPQDTRVGRPERTGVVKGINNKIAARIRDQARRAEARGSLAEFRPNLGHRRQLEEAVGDVEAVDAFFGRMDRWLDTFMPMARSAADVATAVERVLEHEVGKLVA